MQSNRFSRTAQAMALFRALESEWPASRRLFKDPFAASVLPPALRNVVSLARFALLRSAITRVIDRGWPGARTSGIARTRLIDDWVTSAIGGGARQVVILGAGFDSRAWRLPAVVGVPIFEVDHPATTQAKQRRLIAAGLDPRRIVQTAVDFDREPFALAMAGRGFDGSVPTVVIWEGVTNYLTAEAVEAVLRWVGSLARGSALAFTYVHSRALKDPAAFEGAERMLATVAKAGEAWTYGIDPDELKDLLRRAGLELVEDLGADDYRSRYWGGACSRWRGYRFYRAALAIVPAHAEA
jgi:methyltransferase (TIGR00027 family)